MPSPRMSWARPPARVAQRIRSLNAGVGRVVAGTLKRPGRAALLVIVSQAVSLAGCAQAVPGLYPPNPATSQASDIRSLYDIVFGIAVLVFVLVEGLIVWAVVRYRHRGGDQPLPPQIHGNNTLEIVWTAIPMAIVAFLFFVSWQTLNTVEARDQDPAVKIEVVGFQWQWEFKYDGGPTLVGLSDAPPQMVVPVGQTVELTLRSQDVIHAFYVPAFLFKRDVVPGKLNVFDFTVAKAGTYDGHCAEFCGLQHDRMLFTVKAVSPDEFRAWLEKQREPSPSPSPSAPSAQSSGSSPAGSRGGDPTLSTNLQLKASNVAFDRTSLAAPANTPFAIAFTNDDQGVPHNVSIHQGSPTGPEVWRGALLPGPASTVYQVPALPAGTYGFVCSVHPNMTGTLTIR